MLLTPSTQAADDNGLTAEAAAGLQLASIKPASEGTCGIIFRSHFSPLVCFGEHCFSSVLMRSGFVRVHF